MGRTITAFAQSNTDVDKLLTGGLPHVELAITVTTEHKAFAQDSTFPMLR